MAAIEGNLEEVRKDNQEYDQMFQILVKYITREKTAEKLRQEIQPRKQRSNQEIEIVCVPKQRYQKLIQIYSWNIAEITVSQMQKVINSKDAEKHGESPINYIE